MLRKLTFAGARFVKNARFLSSRPQFLAARNGEKVQHAFSDEEMASRKAKILGVMEKQNLDAVVFTSMHNVAYVSDFLYCSFGRNYAAVLEADGTLTTVSAGIDGGQPWRRTAGGDNIVYTDWEKSNFYAALKEVLPDTGSARRIGCEFDHLNVSTFGALDAAFGSSILTDVSDEIMQVRMVKSQEEIEIIKAGAEVADKGGEAVAEILSDASGPIREIDVAQHSTAKMVEEIAHRFPHTELRDTWTWFQSGINTDGAHNPVTSRTLQRGDILSLNCFPMIQGYYTALERTLFYKEIPSDAHLRVWEANVQVHERGLELIRPGNTCGQIAKELNALYEELGSKIGVPLLDLRSFGYGHSFGILSHYYGREAKLELREDNETVLEVGHVVSMEPMVMLPESAAGAGGYREHDILVIGSDGVENITKFPYGPEHNVF